MAYVSIYRKYRPASFGSMIGQRHILRTLQNTVLSGNVAHAYLFTGTRGTGKTTTAKIFAKAINCLAPLPDGSPCGQCEVCLKLSNPNNLDILEIDAASNNGVDEIRELCKTVEFPPAVAKYKVYIIDEVHMLSPTAFNAFLKTLEEPPEYVVFILATTEAHKIPATILSRCVRLDFRLIPVGELRGLLKRIFDDLGRGYSEDALAAIADAGNGSARDALSIAEICLSYADGDLTGEDVAEVLGTTSPELLLELAEYIVDGNIGGALERLDGIYVLGKSTELIARDLTKIFRDVMLCKNCTEAKDLLTVSPSVFDKTSALADKATNSKIIKTIELLTSLEGELKYALSPEILLESVVARACDITANIDTQGVMLRLKDMEEKLRSGVLTGGVSSKQALDVDTSLIWGHLLNVLEEVKGKKSPQYHYASNVDMKKDLTFSAGVLSVSVEKEGIASVLRYYLGEYETIVCERFFEVKRLEVKVVNEQDVVGRGLENLSETFGEDKVKLKNED